MTTKTLNLQGFAERIKNKRGDEGIRVTAEKIGVSPSTLSRIERGYLPDLEIFKLICDWLEVNPGDILGSKVDAKQVNLPAVHFRKENTTQLETASHLAQMILHAQRALEIQRAQRGEELEQRGF